MGGTDSGEEIALLAEFKMSLNAYLKELVKSPVRSLADVIAYNEEFAEQVSTKLQTISIFSCLVAEQM